MISGAFFLNPQKNITISKMYTRYIFRILMVLLGWAVLRTFVLNVWLGHASAANWANDFFTSIKWYWFLPMIIGLYIMTPVLRFLTVSNNRTIMMYFILLSLFLASFLPTVGNIEQFYFPQAISPADFTNLLKIPCFVFGAHFVFGYYASMFDICETSKKVLYVLAVISWLIMAVGGFVFWNEKNNPIYFYCTYGSTLTPLSFITGAAIFVFAKDWLGKIQFSQTVQDIIRRLAYYSLGVYMLHILLVDVAAHFGIFGKIAFFPVLMVPLVAVVLFMLSNSIIAVLYKIPWIKKYFL